MTANMYMTVSERIKRAVVEYGEPITVHEIAELIGTSKTEVNARMSGIVKGGHIKRLGRGVYVSPHNQTLSQVAEIEVRPREAQKPSAPEERPNQGNRTVNLLLEVIARSDDPKPYAGVVREIGDLLATS